MCLPPASSKWLTVPQMVRSRAYLLWRKVTHIRWPPNKFNQNYQVKRVVFNIWPRTRKYTRNQKKTRKIERKKGKGREEEKEGKPASVTAGHGAGQTCGVHILINTSQAKVRMNFWTRCHLLPFVVLHINSKWKTIFHANKTFLMEESGTQH